MSASIRWRSIIKGVNGCFTAKVFKTMYSSSQSRKLQTSLLYPESIYRPLGNISFSCNLLHVGKTNSCQSTRGMQSTSSSSSPLLSSSSLLITSTSYCVGAAKVILRLCLGKLFTIFGIPTTSIRDKSSRRTPVPSSWIARGLVNILCERCMLLFAEKHKVLSPQNKRRRHVNMRVWFLLKTHPSLCLDVEYFLS